MEPSGKRPGVTVESPLREPGNPMQIKHQIIRAIQDLPEDVSFEEALERLYLLYKIERGEKQADAGDLVTQNEARERMAKGLK